MAKFFSIFSKISGLCGNIIFYSQRGKQIAKSRTIPINPSSSQQVYFRSRLSFLSHCGSLLWDPILINFWKTGLHFSEIKNDFVSYNSPLLITLPDYAHLVVSAGPLSKLVNYRTDYYLATGRIRSLWNVVYNLNLLPTDFVMCACLYPNGNKLFYSSTPALYSAGLLNFYIPLGVPYYTIYTYGIVFRPLSSGYISGPSFYDTPAWV